MSPKYARLLLFGTGAALLPFVAVAFFTWARDGRVAGLVAMLGRGELLPPAALLAAQALAASYGAPVPLRRTAWTVEVALSWVTLAMASAAYVVPFAGGSASQARLAWSSLVVFGMAAGLRLATAHWEPDEGGT